MSFSYTVGVGFAKATATPIFRFSVNGDVDLPVLTKKDSPRFNDGAFTITKARVICREAGTAQYRIVIKSYSSSGADEVTHIDDTVTLTSLNNVSLTITSASIGSDRNVQLEVQSLSGTLSSDITVTLV